MDPTKYSLEKITACTMDCPDACSLLVSRAPDGSVRIAGNPDHVFTRGLVCGKIKRHVERLNSPSRQTHPMVKRNGKWEKISWDDALALCAKKIDDLRDTPECILHIHGEGAKGVLKQSGKHFFGILGAARMKGSLCDAAGIVAFSKDFGSRKNHDPRDLLNSAKIVLWGKDLSRSSIHTANIVRKAKANGTSVLTLSPEGDHNRTFADHRIRIRPGTDRFLAAAAIRRMIERDAIDENILSRTKNWESFKQSITSRSMDDLLVSCDVSPDLLDLLLDYYIGNGPCATIVGAGIQRYEFGGENIRFVNALALLSNNTGRPGGGSYFHLNSLGNFNLDWMQTAVAKSRRAFRAPLLAKEILSANPPVRMIWVNGSNIVNQAPDIGGMRKAFEKVELKIVADAFMTDTAMLADIFLPAALMLEQEDVVGSYLHDFIHHASAVLDPPGEARDDFWIFENLGRMLESPVELTEREDFLKNCLNSRGIDISPAGLRSQGYVRANLDPIPYAGLRFDHGDGLYRFPRALHDEPAPPEDYPLRLLSLVRRNAIHSQILPEDQKDLPAVWVSPETLKSAKIDLSRKVYLASTIGRMEVCVKESEGLYPGAVVYRRGDWFSCGGGANRLVEAAATDMGSGAAYYKQYVRLEN